MSEEMVLQTKLQPPQLKGKILRRQRLINLLQENLDKKLILICADAGYGKTTLLAQFCAELDRPYLFYDLDTSDNDIATFFNYLVAGIQQCYSGFGQRTKSIIPQTRNIEIIVGTFINEFIEKCSDVIDAAKKEGGDFYIILDDYHHLQQNKEIGNALDYLLRHLPHNLHLIISSRSTPPLNLAYYLAKQDLFKLEKAQLQFNIKEIQALLKDVHNLKIPDAEIERIEKHSEGWITAIQLILQKISATGEDKTKETLNGYITSGEEIFNYFAKEVFDAQPKEIQEFLMKTSILNFLTPDICIQIFGIKESREIIEYLLAEHLFISVLEGKYKYHPLFRDFLENCLLNLKGEEEKKKLHFSTGEFFGQKNDIPSAIEHFLKAGEYNKAAVLLENLATELLSDFKFTTFLDYIRRIPYDLLINRPYLATYYGECCLYLNRFDEAVEYFKLAEVKFYIKKDKPWLAKLLWAMALMKSQQGEFKTAIELINRALKLMRRKNYTLRIKLLGLLGGQYYKLGELTKTHDIVIKATEIAKISGNKKILLMLLNNLGAVNQELGLLKEAEKNYDEILKISAQLGIFTPPVVYCNLARIYFLYDKKNDAKKLIDCALDQAKKINDRKSEVIALITYGEYYYECGNLKDAISKFREAEEMNQPLGDEILNQKISYSLSEVYLAKNEIIRANDLIDDAIRRAKKTNNFYGLPVFLLTKGKIRLKQKQYQKALKLLNECIAYCKRGSRNFHLTEALFYASRCYLEQEKTTKAIKCLKEMMAIIQRFKYSFYLKKIATQEPSIIQFLIQEKIEIESLREILGENITIEPIKVTFLGGFRVVIKKQEVPDSLWKTEKIRSIFSYFVINRKRKISKDELMANFYPNSNPTKASQNIRWAIYIIRNIFGEKEIIQHQGKNYCLNLCYQFLCDTDEFEAKVKLAKKLERENLARAIQLYKEAIKVYQGDFLTDFYDPWCDDYRRCYLQEYIDCLKKIGDYYSNIQHYEEALNYYHQIIKKDEYDETVNYQILRIYKLMGECHKAAKFYNRLVEKYQNEGLLLPSKISAVYQEISKRT